MCDGRLTSSSRLQNGKDDEVEMDAISSIKIKSIHN